MTSSGTLRQQSEALGVSARRYATRRFVNPGTLSRYLAGSRVPPWKFVQDLLTDVAEERGVPARTTWTWRQSWPSGTGWRGRAPGCGRSSARCRPG